MFNLHDCLTATNIIVRDRACEAFMSAPGDYALWVIGGLALIPFCNWAARNLF